MISIGTFNAVNFSIDLVPQCYYFCLTVISFLFYSVNLRRRSVYSDDVATFSANARSNQVKPGQTQSESNYSMKESFSSFTKHVCCIIFITCIEVNFFPSVLDHCLQQTIYHVGRLTIII